MNMKIFGKVIKALTTFSLYVSIKIFSVLYNIHGYIDKFKNVFFDFEHKLSIEFKDSKWFSKTQNY